MRRGKMKGYSKHDCKFYLRHWFFYAENYKDCENMEISGYVAELPCV